MAKTDYLPLGSIVLLESGIKKLMIIARGLTVKLNGEEKFFDYGGVQYPEGLSGDQMAYFNHDGIAKVIFSGYSDDDDKVIVDNINKFVLINNVKKADVEKLREEQGT